MTKWIFGVVTCSVCMFSAVWADFNTAPGIVNNKGISRNGSVVLLRTYSPQYAAFRWVPSIQLLNIGDLEGGVVRTVPSAMNPDGSTIVGYSSSVNGDSEAFRWTIANQIEGLGDLPGGRFQSDAFGCSDDGSVVFGEAYIGASGQFRGYVPTYWRNHHEGMVSLGSLPGGDDNASVTDCSADGTVFVGSDGTDTGHQSFRWALGNMVGLGLLQNSSGALIRENSAFAVSSDGQLIGGYGYHWERGYNYYPTSLWIWEADSKFTEIADAPGNPFATGDPPFFRYDTIFTDNLDTIVAGYSNGLGDGILRWSKHHGLNELQPYGKTIAAWHMSGDGRFVVGTSFNNANVPSAVIWDADGRIHMLEDLLTEEGIGIGDLNLASANAISEDGRTIAGNIVAPFNDPVAYHVTLPSHPLFDEQVNDVWKRSPWYGSYTPYTDSTIWHYEHGWQEFIIGKFGSVYLYDHKLGLWFWTTDDYYPLLYIYGTGNGWVEYIVGSSPRKFYVFATHQFVFGDDLVPIQP